MYYVFYLLGKLILYITLFVILLSVTGKTTYVREICAKLLLFLFEWGAKQNSQSGDVNESEEDDVGCDEPPSEGSSESGEYNLWTRKRSRHNSGDHSNIIVRRWSAALGEKLKRSASSHRHLSDLDSDGGFDCVDHSDCGSGITDHNEHQTVKVIVNDTWEFIGAGIEAIIEDEVTTRFKTAQLASWNFLLRNRASSYVRMNWKLCVIWFAGFLFRYLILFPVRLLLFLISMALIVTLLPAVGLIKNETIKAKLYARVMLMCMRISSRAFSSIVKFHNKENRPKYGVCVANHTSPIDVMILSCDSCYALVGQKQGGVLGLLQTALSHSSDHIWFERTESNDRKKVAERLEQHVEDQDKLPMLIFPEGTCINNTSVMMFKKGSFEISTTIYPIAMKYDNRLGDPFWNSHEQGYMTYLLSMMTSWALMCDVWYLPPVTREEGENAIDFARRVQRLIARKGGLVDLNWDGNLKRAKVPERLKDEQKELFFQHLARTTSICSCGKPTDEQFEQMKKQIYSDIFEEPENKETGKKKESK
ncbi:acyltransferase domain-containing protein [Ditylenchus destructor]|uniref:Acyltransferase domain-containing protein n=1 Tax=Ditylenchus destructor TaxID=166010 RepID=A0AAD4NEL9_9BILA|nr:acyltransferase domain-containing protein [Ditylenchus destructor]